MEERIIPALPSYLIQGSSGNDQITVIARDSSYNPAMPGVPNPLLDGVQDFTVSVNGGPDMLFINQPFLLIDSLAGNDNIVVQEPAPNNAAWNVQIYVAGGSPAGGVGQLGDTVVLETPGTQNVTYSPDPASIPPVPGNPSITFPGSPNPTETAILTDSTNSSAIIGTPFLIPNVYQSSPGGVGAMAYQGGGGNDNLTYNSPANSNSGSNLVYTPGANPDAGTITATLVGGAALVPLTFSNLGTGNSAAGVHFTTSNTGRTDHLNVEGSPNAVGESFSVTPANNGTVQITRLQNGNTNLVTVPIFTPSVSTLELDGQGGSDQFSLTGTLPYTSTVIDDGATVNLGGAAGPVTVFLGNNTPNSPNPNTVITGYGAPVTLIDVDTANLDATNNQVTATGTTQNDNIIYTPTGATAGTFYDDLGSGNNLVPNTVFNIAHVAGNFMVFNDPGGNADQVTLRGTAARDLIEINQGTGVAQVLANNVTPLLPVELGISVEILNAEGVGGENTFQVIPAPGIGGQAQDNLLINLDGGTTGASNALVVASSFGASPGTLAANVFAVVNKSPLADSGTVRVFTAAVANPDINYTNVQTVTPNVSGGSVNPNLLVMGPDLNEPNEQQGTATFLGSGPTIQVQHAAIFPSNSEFPGTPADNDFYQVVAQSTGTLDFQVFFRTFNAALLPAGGNLSVAVLDANGNVLATGTTHISVPVTAGQSYFLHVFGATAAVVNGYDVTITNNGPINLDATNPNVTIRVDPGDSTNIQVLSGVMVLRNYANNPASQINIVGDGSDNTVTVDSSNGLVKASMNFDGGGGSNTLVLTQTGGATQTSDTYTVGPNPGQGTAVITGPSGTQTVTFQNLAPVLDNAPATTATVNGTNGDNAINYAQGPGGGIFTGNTGFVTVDNQESYEFNNKTNLVINGLAGSDTINLNNPTTPAGLTSITVNGGDPTAATDTLVANGTTATDTINYAPTSASGGSITGAGPVSITFSNIEQADINGQGGNDTLTVTTPAGGNIINLTPGALADSGTVTLRQFVAAGGSSLLGVSFVNLGVDNTLGRLSFADAGGMRTDSLTINGVVNASEIFGVSAAGNIDLSQPTPLISPLIRLLLNVATPGVAELQLVGLASNDEFDVAGNHPFTEGIFLDGERGGLFFTGDGTAAVTSDLGKGEVTEAGFGPVDYIGLAVVNVDAANQNLHLVTTTSDDNLAVTPTGTNAVTAQLTTTAPGGGETPIVNGSNIGTFNVDLLAGSNQLTVNGTQAADTITVTGAVVTVGTRKTVNYTNVDSLAVNGLAGSDTFNVTASATTAIAIDGGDPIGVLPGDSLHVVANPGDTVKFFNGPTSDSGGITVNNNQPISYTHIESLPDHVADHLLFLQQPSNTTAGLAIAPPVQVEIVDKFNNVVNSSALVMLTPIGPGPFDPSSMPFVSAVNGVAIFGNLKLDTAGAYTLSASSSGLTGAGSQPFTVSAAGATALFVVSGGGQSTQVNTAFAAPIVVKVVDAFGNPVSGATVTFTGPGFGASAIFGTAAPTDSSGQTSVTATANLIAGTNYTNAAAVTGGGFGSTTFLLTNTSLPAIIVTGPDFGGLPEVQAYNSAGQKIADFFAFAPSFTGGVRVAVGDVNGDGIQDILTATGPGGATEVKVFSGSNHAVLYDFFAFAPTFSGGVFVAAGDLNADGYADIVVGLDAGGLPEVKAFSGKSGGVLYDFLAYAPNFIGGVRVAAGDVNGDGFSDIITGTGPLVPPEVKVFSGQGGAKLQDYLAYGVEYLGGIYVAAGDVNGDGKAEVITAPGSDNIAEIRVFGGGGVVLRDFLAYPPAMTPLVLQPNFNQLVPLQIGGFRVAAADVTGDGKADLITVPAFGLPPDVKVFDAVSLTVVDDFFAYSPAFLGGAFVGGG